MIEIVVCRQPKIGNTAPMKSNVNSKLIGGLLAALFVICAPSLASGQGDSLGSLSASGKVKVETSGTGNTIGHVADLKIQNLTPQPLTISIAPMILESSSGKNQDYACPKGQTVALAPNQTKTVPIDGVCLDRNLPPVGKGVGGDLVINEANPTAPQNPNSHLPATYASNLLRICTAKYEAAEKLQKEGALNKVPYDAQKRKDIVVQWSTWTDPVISQMTGSPPATKEQLRDVVYKQMPGPMTQATKKKIDKGIDAIFAAVELTTAKAKDLEKPEKETPPVAGTTVAQTPSGGQPVSAPTGTPGETVAGTPTGTPQGPGTTTTQPATTPTPKPPEATPTPPCIDDLIDLARAKDGVAAAVKACTDLPLDTLDALIVEAAKAKAAADADDLTPAGQAAKEEAKKAADAVQAAETALKEAVRAKNKVPEKVKKLEAAKEAAKKARSPLRKAADDAQDKAEKATEKRNKPIQRAKDAIAILKCRDNIDKLNTALEECNKREKK